VKRSPAARILNYYATTWLILGLLFCVADELRPNGQWFPLTLLVLAGFMAATLAREIVRAIDANTDERRAQAKYLQLALQQTAAANLTEAAV